MFMSLRLQINLFSITKVNSSSSAFAIANRLQKNRSVPSCSSILPFDWLVDYRRFWMILSESTNSLGLPAIRKYLSLCAPAIKNSNFLETIWDWINYELYYTPHVCMMYVCRCPHIHSHTLLRLNKSNKILVRLWECLLVQVSLFACFLL